MALTDAQQTMDAYFRDLLNHGDYSRHFSDDVVVEIRQGQTSGIVAVKPRRTGSKVFTHLVRSSCAMRSWARHMRPLRPSSSVRMESRYPTR